MVIIVCLFVLLLSDVSGFMRINNAFIKRSSYMMSTLETNKIDNFKVNEYIQNDNVNLEELNDDNFINKMNENNLGTLSVVLFTSDWCGPCNAMETLYKSEILPYVRNNLKGDNVKLFSCNTDVNQASCQVFMVRSIPTIIMFRDGDIVSEIIGSVDSTIVTDQINKYSDQVLLK